MSNILDNQPHAQYSIIANINLDMKYNKFVN